MRFSTFLRYFAALMVVALAGPTMLFFCGSTEEVRVEPKCPIVPASSSPSPSSTPTTTEPRSIDPYNLALPSLVTSLVQSDEPDHVKELLDPVLPSLVTVVWVNREKFSYTKPVLEDWWRNDHLGIRCIYVLSGLEQDSLVEWLKEKERTLGKDRFTLLEDDTLLPPFATVNIALEHVRTKYFVGIHADTVLEPLSLHYFLRRALLTPDAVVIDPIIWEEHLGSHELILHSTYELLTASKTSDRSSLVPHFLHLPRQHVSISWSASSTSGSIRELTKKYVATQPMTAMGVEFHCAFFETAAARHPYKLLDTFAPENPLNAAFVVAEMSRIIVVEPQAIAKYVFPEGSNVIEQEDVFMMMWAWSPEMGYISNCYAESKFGHTAENPRFMFWVRMIGYRMRGLAFGIGTAKALLPDPTIQTQMVIGAFLLVGSNRFRLFNPEEKGDWLEPRKFYLEAKNATYASSTPTPVQMEFAQKKDLFIPKWNGEQMKKWLERVAVHETENKKQHKGFVMHKTDRLKVEGFDCSTQTYRQYHLLRVDFEVDERVDESECLSALPSVFTAGAFIVMAVPTTDNNKETRAKKLRQQFWFEFPNTSTEQQFLEEVLPTAKMHGGQCAFVEAQSNPTSILLPTMDGAVRLLRWKHNFNYDDYTAALASHIIRPHVVA